MCILHPLSFSVSHFHSYIPRNITHPSKSDTIVLSSLSFTAISDVLKRVQGATLTDAEKENLKQRFKSTCKLEPEDILKSNCEKVTFVCKLRYCCKYVTTKFDSAM